MNLIAKLTSSSAVQDIRNNIRLQWMLTLVCLILMLSATKSFSDLVAVQQAERTQQVALYQRMQSAANQPLNEATISEVQALFATTFNNLPKAGSESIAQAKALTLMESIINDKIERARINVVLSEPLDFTAQKGYQVRLNVAGRMPEKALISLLTKISGDQPAIRLLSMQYNPKLSNSLTLVADFLYLEEDASES